jgi:RES domain
LARLGVRGTFSQPGPSRPAAAVRLARTLGLSKTNSPMPDLPTLFAKTEALRGALLQARTIASLERQLEEFRHCAGEVYDIKRDYAQLWCRARLCLNNEPFSDLSRLLYPPDGSPDFGRAQYRGSKVLYASWNDHTALEEIGTTVGDLVQIVHCRVRSPLQLTCQVVGELQFFHASGRSQIRAGPAAEFLHKERREKPYEFLASVLFDSVLAETFRKPVKRSYEYKVSAAYAEWYYQSGGGLIYPSVEHLGAMNLAVPANIFDTKFEVLSTSVFRVIDYVGYGIFNLRLERFSSGFHPDGTIDWSKTTPLPYLLNAFGGAVVDPTHVGWRKA